MVLFSCSVASHLYVFIPANTPGQVVALIACRQTSSHFYCRAVGFDGVMCGSQGVKQGLAGHFQAFVLHTALPFVLALLLPCLPVGLLDAAGGPNSVLQSRTVRQKLVVGKGKKNLGCGRENRGPRLRTELTACRCAPISTPPSSIEALGAHLQGDESSPYIDCLYRISANATCQALIKGPLTANYRLMLSVKSSQT